MRIKDQRPIWAAKGEEALRGAGYDGDCVEDNAQDTIVAILHYCWENSVDYYDVLEQAQVDFEYEINDLHQEEDW